MRLQIFPKPILKGIARPLSGAELEVYADLQDDFLDAESIMKSAGGVAIAAPQVGLSERWWVRAEERTVIANPVIELTGPTALMTEGCLSLPGHCAAVKRATSIRIQGYRLGLGDLDPKFVFFDEVWTGEEAHIAQHEFDHLEGKLYTQRLGSAEKGRIEGAVRKSGR